MRYLDRSQPMAGYMTGRKLAMAEDQNQMSQMQGILAIQGALEQAAQRRELQPLQLEKARADIARAQELAKLRAAAMGGMGGDAPPVLGGMSTPGSSGEVVRQPQQGLPPRVRALLASGDPGLMKLGEQEAALFKPTDIMREAEALGMQPGTPEYNNYINRTSRAIAERQGTARVDAGWKVEEVPDPQRPWLNRKMPLPQAIEYLGGGQPAPQAQPAPQSPPTAQPLPAPEFRIPPQVQAQRDADAAKIIARETQPNGGGAIPTNRVVGNWPTMPPSPTAGRTAQPLPPGTALPKPDESYEWKQNASGDWEQAPIPGGKADREIKAKEEKEKSKLTQSDNTIKIVKNKVDEALASVGFMSSGFASVTKGIPGTPAYDLAKNIDTIKSNIGFQALQVMRDNSPTGGALGQVAVQELDMLQATIANLDPGQSREQLEKNLAQVKQHFTNWEAIVNGQMSKYQPVQGGKPIPPAGANPAAKSPTQDWSATYKSKQDAIRDAQNSMMRGAPKAAVIKRLESLGITDHGIR